MITHLPYFTFQFTWIHASSIDLGWWQVIVALDPGTDVCLLAFSQKLISICIVALRKDPLSGLLSLCHSELIKRGKGEESRCHVTGCFLEQQGNKTSVGCVFHMKCILLESCQSLLTPAMTRRFSSCAGALHFCRVRLYLCERDTGE